MSVHEWLNAGRGVLNLHRKGHCAFIIGAVLQCLLLLLSSCGFLDTLFPPEQIPFGGKNRSLLYIYYSDDSTAQEYRLFLEKREYSTDIIHISDVTFTDLSLYGVLLAGPDTGASGGWGIEENVSAMKNSGRPVIGIWEGGASLFNALGLSIGGTDRSTFNDGAVYVTDDRHPIFNEPDVIDIPSTHVIDLYTNTSCIGINQGILSPSVFLYGRNVSSQAYYTLLQEDCFFFWGFSDSPEAMTETGKVLFCNILEFLNVD